MISRRFAIFALLLGCGKAPPAAPVSVSIHALAKTTPVGEGRDTPSSDEKWWTRFDIPDANNVREIFPDDRGGARVFVERGEGTTWGDWRSWASFVDVDAAGREVGNISAVEGVLVNVGEVALGKDGNVVLAGGYQGTMGIEGVKIADSKELPGSTRMSMYVVALDRKGQLAWKHTFTNAKPWSIARRADGVVVVSGTLEGLSDFGGGTFGLKTADTTFIAAFDARGNHLFSRAFDMSNMGGSHVAFLGDSTIDLFATLGFNVHDLDFGDGPHRGITSLGTAVARFDDHGKCLKSSIISILAKSVAVGPSGDAVVTGETTEPESNARSQLVLRVDGDGHEMWRRAFPSDTVGFRWAPVALDAHGNALSAILAPTALGEPSFVDVILFDKLGTEIYRQRMHDDAYLRISDVAFSSSGAAFIAGQSTGRELVYDGDVLPANHSFGVFLMKLPNPAAK